MLEWPYHLIRRSVAPEHATAWLAVQTIATVLAFAAAYLLFRQSDRSNQAVLMQQLMVEYDGLRDHIRTLEHWFMETASAGVDPIKRFGEAINADYVSADARAVDDARFAISRFFVKIRKLSLEGFLQRRIVVMALGRSAIEDVVSKGRRSARSGEGRG